MNLKEEIKEYIKGLPFQPYVQDTNIDLYTNAILFRFEKRIYSRIQYYRKNLCFTQSDPILLELEDIKKELLK